MNDYTPLFAKVPFGCHRISHGPDHLSLDVDGSYRTSLTVRTSIILVIWAFGALALRHARNINTGAIGAPPAMWLAWGVGLLALLLILLHAATRHAYLTLTQDQLTFELRSVLWRREQQCDRTDVTAVAMVERESRDHRRATPALVEPTPSWAVWVRTNGRSIRILQRAVNEHADPVARLLSDWSGARLSIEPRRRGWFFTVDF